MWIHCLFLRHLFSESLQRPGALPDKLFSPSSGQLIVAFTVIIAAGNIIIGPPNLDGRTGVVVGGWGVRGGGGFMANLILPYYSYKSSNEAGNRGVRDLNRFIKSN